MKITKSAESYNFWDKGGGLCHTERIILLQLIVNVLATKDVYSYMPSRFYMEMQCLMNYRFGPCETCLSPLLVINS